MNANEQEIETILRNPPRMKAPAGLRQRLLADIPNGSSFQRTSPLRSEPAGWLRRWLPLLLPGAVALGSGIVLTMQRMEIHDLKSSVDSLASAAGPASASPQSEQNGQTATTVARSDSTPRADEVTRLRETTKSLRAEVATLESLATENARLKQELAKPATIAGLTDEEQKALQEAKDRAARIQCVNNLKQIGLATRIWSLDNQDKIAPDFLTMSNELNTPKILACPADAAHPSVAGWDSYTAANCSYEYFPGDGKPGQDPQRILTRCPIHGNIGLFDGSVQMAVMKNHPEYVVRGDDGQLYFRVPTQPEPANPNGSSNR